MNATPTRRQIRRWRKYLAEERIEEQTYRSLAAKMDEPDREIILGLAEAERRHQRHWEILLGEHAASTPKAPLFTRLTAWMIQHISSVFVLALAQRSEQRSAYDVEGDATAQMAADERIHGEVVRSLATKSRERLAGPLRAGLFGANDGLVSNLALILGVAGAGMSAQNVIITGISGLLSGALSMGAGEWVSVSGQRELLDASKPDPRATKAVPDLDVRENELELLFRARGETPEEAAKHAARIFAASAKGDGDTVTLSLAGVEAQTELAAGHPNFVLGGTEEDSESVVGVIARETDSAEVIGTPWQAARSSFLAFAVGALLPLLPYLCGLEGMAGALTSAIVVAISLLVTGALVAVLSGRSALRFALRQVAIGFGAATMTFLLGLLFGTTTA